MTELRIVARVQTHPTDQLFRYEFYSQCLPKQTCALRGPHAMACTAARAVAPQPPVECPAIGMALSASEDIRRPAAIWRRLPRSASDSAGTASGCGADPDLPTGGRGQRRVASTPWEGFGCGARLAIAVGTAACMVTLGPDAAVEHLSTGSGGCLDMAFRPFSDRNAHEPARSGVRLRDPMAVAAVQAANQLVANFIK